MKVGYARVSTIEQNEARQIEWLQNDVKVDKLFVDKASGKNINRPEFKKMMDYVREGDVLYVESISRLSRSIRDLLKTVDELESKGVKFVSNKESIDTSTPQGRFVLTIFAALAELERDQTRQRQKEGIEIAKREGKYKGRSPKAVNEDQFKKLYKRWKTKEITAVSFQKSIGLLPNAFYRRVKRFETEGIIN